MNVLVVHGAGGSAADYADFVAAVQARGWTASGLDLLGHGEYEAEPFGDPVGWVSSHADPSACLWGASLGAYSVLHAAALSPHCAVVAIAPTTEATIRERMDTWGVRIHPHFREWLDSRDIAQAVPRIRCPVLYVHARDDERIPLAVSEQLHELTPRSELVVLESGGHSGPAHDPAVHELTLGWLERVVLA